nr:unnamed protein product [Meloidogyne enterolobii]
MIIYRITTNSQVIFITPTTGNIKRNEEIIIQVSKIGAAKTSETVTIEWVNQIFGKQNLFASKFISSRPRYNFL